MRRGLIALAAGLLVTSLAQAYIAPTTFLLLHWIQIRVERKIFSLQVVMQTTTHGAARTTERETVTFLSPWRVRAEREVEGGKVLRIRDGEREWVEAPGQKGTRRQAEIDLLWDLFSCAEESEDSAQKARDRLLGTLKRLGIDGSKTSLTRFDGRIAIVIGADPWDRVTPQLWLDKDGLYPLRLIARENGDARRPLLDVRLRGYGGSKTSLIFPEVIEVYRDGALWRRSEVEEVTVAPKLTPAQFKIP
ncbi:MAG: hypothetical protein ABIJ09_00530 [Pseudomonadota bacterium]